ncbi:hypothetical protein EBT16_03010 [bacterium]|nr:hypothetical protein [bacterium]
MSRHLIVTILLLISGAANTHAALVNAVAGKVGDQLITVQDAYFFRGLQRFRSGTRPVVLIETDKSLKATIQKTMFEKMIVQEAKTVGFKETASSEASEFLKRKKEQGHASDWAQLLRAFSISEGEALRRLQEGLLAEKFLQKKIESLTPVITDSEVEQYIKNYPERAKKLGDKNRLMIAEALKKERIDKGLQDYIDFLTEKYSATLLLS